MAHLSRKIKAMILKYAKERISGMILNKNIMIHILKMDKEIIFVITIPRYNFKVREIVQF